MNYKTSKFIDVAVDLLQQHGLSNGHSCISETTLCLILSRYILEHRPPVSPTSAHKEDPRKELLDLCSNS